MWLTVAVGVAAGMVLLGMFGIMVLYAMAEHQERQDVSILPESYAFCSPPSPGKPFAKQAE